MIILAPGYGRRIQNLTATCRLRATRELLASLAGVQAELALRRLARLRAIDEEIHSLRRQIAQVVKQGSARLMAVPGVGPLVAAKLRGETGDVQRFSSPAAFAMACGVAPRPASSGRTQRHRLNRGGKRQLNRALHIVALIQTRVEPRAKVYLDRKRAEGKSWREAIRCLKRHLADVIYRAMLADAAELEEAA